eukprot:1017753-Ditylum_brightwellii.AAC.1
MMSTLVTLEHQMKQLSLSLADSDVKTPISNNIKKEEENQNDNNFGGFGTSNEAAEPSSSVGVSSVESAVEIPVINNMDQDGHNNDNFGDFGTSNKADEPASTEVSPVDFATEIPVSNCNAILKE